MRVLQISSARAFGGGERHLTDLVRRLAARGHEVFVAHRPNSSLQKILAEETTVKCFPVPMRHALDATSAIELARAIRDHKIEIVHAHLARDYTLAAFAVHLANFAKGKCVKLIFTRHVPFPLGSFHKLTCAQTSRVIAVSNGVAQQLIARRMIDPGRVRVIHHGIDFHSFDLPRANGRQALLASLSLPAETKFFVGAIGELSPNKGFDVLIRAAKIVRERFDESVHFIIVGEDNSRNQETRKKLEDLISQLQLAPFVHLLGWCDEVASLLAALDVFVSSSRAEAFGLALVEALACGAPVVATATDGAREVINDENLGMLVPVDEAETMARAIINLLEDERRRAQISTNARQAARARFSVERMVDETEAIYREVLSEG